MSCKGPTYGNIAPSAPAPPSHFNSLLNAARTSPYTARTSPHTARTSNTAHTSPHTASTSPQTARTSIGILSTSAALKHDAKLVTCFNAAEVEVLQVLQAELHKFYPIIL